ncbi:hypothetical protein SPWS13_1086 [Shewanella putrefaciens]|nr:hypothetical protein SPWS13_1086 [Shewanella putrefaciens]
MSNALCNSRVINYSGIRFLIIKFDYNAHHYWLLAQVAHS